MRILAIGFIYNERPYLPELIKYYRNQGCELYLIDNCSTDGTFEYLVSNGIQCHKFDTDDCFHLDWLQVEMNRVIHEIKPDWVVYIAGDLYHIFNPFLEQEIENAELCDCNQINTRCFEFFNTGEIYSTPLYKNYFYGREYTRLNLISKYDKSLKIIGDDIYINKKEIFKSSELTLNYGGCKPKEIQEAKLQRTINAWDKGMNKGWSHHFPENKKHGWLWSKDELQHYSEYDKTGLIQRFIENNE